MIYLELFLGFLRVGLFAFGGGYGAVPLIRDIVTEYGWLTDEELTVMIAVSESTPGSIMVNLATFIGYDQAGILGAVLATLAVILPAFVIILLVMFALKALMKHKYFRAVLGGVTPCIIGIILATGIFMTYGVIFSAENGNLSISSAAMTALLALIYFGSKPVFKKQLSPIALIGISAVLGAAVFGIMG